MISFMYTCSHIVHVSKANINLLYAHLFIWYWTALTNTKTWAFYLIETISQNIRYANISSVQGIIGIIKYENKKNPWHNELIKVKNASDKKTGERIISRLSIYATSFIQ